MKKEKKIMSKKDVLKWYKIKVKSDFYPYKIMHIQAVSRADAVKELKKHGYKLYYATRKKGG